MLLFLLREFEGNRTEQNKSKIKIGIAGYRAQHVSSVCARVSISFVIFIKTIFQFVFKFGANIGDHIILDISKLG